MGVIDDFDNLSKDAQEYLKRRVDGVKMDVIEELSVMNRSRQIGEDKSEHQGLYRSKSGRAYPTRTLP